MGFSLYTLTLGCFLMVLPYLSEGATVTMEMSEHTPINSKLNVICRFESPINGLVKMTLKNGGNEISVTYSPVVGDYVVPNSNVAIGPGTVTTGGFFNFTIPIENCDDFTWYMCVGEGGDTAKSENKTLKVLPKVNPIRETEMILHNVNVMSYFECSGVVSNEGTYDLQWYRGVGQQRSLIGNSVSASAQVTTTVASSDQCSRTILSKLSYNVSEADGSHLILWCQLDSGTRNNMVMGNFTIQAGLDAGSIVGIVLGLIALIVLVVLLVWFLVVRPKRLKADGPSKDQGPEPNAKDYQAHDMKGEVNPALDDKHDADNAPYTVMPSKYENPPGGHENPAMDQDMPNHMSGSTV